MKYTHKQFVGEQSTSLRKSLSKFIKSKYAYPTLLAIPLIILVILGISGSSIGIYNGYFNGTTTKDQSLIVGAPRSIRSDEWIVTTQLTIAQSKNNFERINKNIGDGTDMSVIGDVLSGSSLLLYTISSYGLGYIIPLVTSFVYLLVFLTSFFVLKETFTLIKSLASCLYCSV